MGVSVNRITIKNFKNLRNITIYPKKFNVLIGPNGSGKTNFLEFFKLLRKIYVERNPYPFLEWDGYENVVWNHRVDLPIEFEFETVERTSLSEFVRKYSFEDVNLNKDIPFDIFRRISASFWADRTENLKILKELIELEIPEFNFRFCIKKAGKKWVVELGDERYEKGEITNIKSLHIEILKAMEGGLNLMKKEDSEIIHKFIYNLYMYFVYLFFKINENLELKSTKFIEYLNNIGVVSEGEVSLDNVLLSTVPLPLFILFRSLVLFTPNLAEIKYKRRIIPRDEPLSERGENALDILALIQLRDNKLPDRIEYVAENYFNGRAYFKNMNLYLYDIDKKVEFSKEHLPDGFVKLLVILTALEQNPSILLIDEIENSLHPELIEFVVETLREEGNCTFVATHSPIVLDLVDPEEVWIFRPGEEGVEIRNVTEYKSKEELLKELEELGISLGEKVLYGFI